MHSLSGSEESRLPSASFSVRLVVSSKPGAGMHAPSLIAAPGLQQLVSRLGSEHTVVLCTGDIACLRLAKKDSVAHTHACHSPLISIASSCATATELASTLLPG